jgi:hypothetical protein
MNTKRDTLEKRVVGGKHEFQIKTGKQPVTRATSSTTTAPPSEYTPSIEDQYLPKSLRGNSSNPYSIMNSMTETIQEKKDNAGIVVAPPTPTPDEAHIPSTVANAASVALASATTTLSSNNGDATTPPITQKPSESVTLLASVPVSEYVSGQKEVTLTTANL